VRKAKKRAYEKLEQQQEEAHDRSNTKQSLGWVTNLFSTKPQSETAEDKARKRDHNLVRFYDKSIEKLKKMILQLNIPNFEKSYISMIQELNLRK
jgi:hypothetical protein